MHNVHKSKPDSSASMAIIATPYGYSYDTVPMCLAVAWIYATSARPVLALLTVAWLFPFVVQMLNIFGLAIGVLVPIAVSGYLLWRAYATQKRVSVTADPVRPDAAGFTAS